MKLGVSLKGKFLIEDRSLFLKIISGKSNNKSMNLINSLIWTPVRISTKIVLIL